MRRLASAVVLIVAFSCATPAADRWTKRPDGSIRVTPPPVPAELRSAPWPGAWEEEFWSRANHVIRGTANGSGRYGNTWFENEKRSYGWAMLSVIGGYQEAGIRFLEAEDAAAGRWNQHTLGIDYFPCFTLKHQMRKYFFFGEALDAAYRKRMRNAAKIFTEKDPLGRPHPAYAGESGWGPEREELVGRRPQHRQPQAHAGHVGLSPRRGVRKRGDAPPLQAAPHGLHRDDVLHGNGGVGLGELPGTLHRSGPEPL